jgi:pyrimidine deaminase RibD-like protein
MTGAVRLVTVGGECFGVAARSVLDLRERDGLLYKFHLTDMFSDRGIRRVSVFAAGTLEIVLPNYKSRVGTACVNAIRRAFDAGILRFDAPFDEQHYTQLQLSELDFENQRARTEPEIRQYIIHKAYWLAYRFPAQPEETGIIYPIPFDEPADLDYLGVTAADVRRNVKRLANQALLEKVLEGHARPTELLLSKYESGDRSALGLPTAVPVAANGSNETDDRKFARLAIDEARKSVPEDDRVHPKVGVVIVKDGRVLATAHRGEIPQCHAEYIALEKKLADVPVSSATVYTTLEPCTSRSHPKVPCAVRLVERKVARVVIGMLDPDDRISGRGQRTLRKAGIATELFPHKFMSEIEELNRDFMRDRETHRQSPSPGIQGAPFVVSVPLHTQAARTLIDATRELQKAVWSYVEFHSQYGIARAARDVANDERRILEKILMPLRIFEQDYDLPTDLARIAKEEVANINISLHRLTSEERPEVRKIAAQQVQDACHKVREAAKPYAYSNATGDDAKASST